jgi:hypothetical protein
VEVPLSHFINEESLLDPRDRTDVVELIAKWCDVSPTVRQMIQDEFTSHGYKLEKQ